MEDTSFIFLFFKINSVNLGRILIPASKKQEIKGVLECVLVFLFFKKVL